MVYAILKSGYVINRIIADETPIYPHPHDWIFEDAEGYTHIGDWYEESEGLFYRPVNGIPPDVPSELNNGEG
jgi:hypothetical protein